MKKKQPGKPTSQKKPATTQLEKSKQKWEDEQILVNFKERILLALFLFSLTSKVQFELNSFFIMLTTFISADSELKKIIPDIFQKNALEFFSKNKGNLENPQQILSIFLAAALSLIFYKPALRTVEKIHNSITDYFVKIRANPDFLRNSVLI